MDGHAVECDAVIFPLQSVDRSGIVVLGITYFSVIIGELVPASRSGSS
jgi:hypothetical protein